MHHSRFHGVAARREGIRVAGQDNVAGRLSLAKTLGQPQQFDREKQLVSLRYLPPAAVKHVCVEVIGSRGRDLLPEQVQGCETGLPASSVACQPHVRAEYAIHARQRAYQAFSFSCWPAEDPSALMAVGITRREDLNAWERFRSKCPDARTRRSNVQGVTRSR